MPAPNPVLKEGNGVAHAKPSLQVKSLPQSIGSSEIVLALGDHETALAIHLSAGKLEGREKSCISLWEVLSWINKFLVGGGTQHLQLC